MPSSPQHDNPPPPNSITTLYQALVGPLGRPHYLARFTRFDDIGRSFPTWNWAASLLTLNWLLFRGLWGPALGYAGALAGAALGVFGLGKVVLGFSDDSVHALLGVGLAIAFVVPGMYGDAWYHRRCKRQMADAILTTDDNAQAARKLAGLAPSPRRLGLLALGNAAVLAPVVALWTLSWQLPGLGKPSGAPAPAASASGAAGAAMRPASAIAPASTPASAVSAASSAGEASVGAGRVGGGSIALAHEPAAGGASAALAGPVGSAPGVAPTASMPARTETTASAPASPGAAGASSPSSAMAPQAATTVAASAAAPAKPRPPPTPAPKAARFFVDAGIYAQAANAKRAVDSLRDAKLPVQSEELDMVRGVRTRVRVGPFASRAQAEQAARQVEGMGLPALVEPAR